MCIRDRFDARRDIVKSTEVAINYLSYLNQKFGNDWSLTLASYNGGEGTVAKSIKKNLELGKDPNFWQLSLPLETENYVPKFYALAYILKNRKKFNLEIVPIYIYRLRDEKLVMEIMQPISYKDSKSSDKELITENLNDLIEKLILRNPGQWIWTHNRWK